MRLPASTTSRAITAALAAALITTPFNPALLNAVEPTPAVIARPPLAELPTSNLLAAKGLDAYIKKEAPAEPAPEAEAPAPPPKAKKTIGKKKAAPAAEPAPVAEAPAPKAKKTIGKKKVAAAKAPEATAPAAPAPKAKKVAVKKAAPKKAAAPVAAAPAAAPSEAAAKKAAVKAKTAEANKKVAEKAAKEKAEAKKKAVCAASSTALAHPHTHVSHPSCALSYIHSGRGEEGARGDGRKGQAEAKGGRQAGPCRSGQARSCRHEGDQVEGREGHAGAEACCRKASPPNRRRLLSRKRRPNLSRRRLPSPLPSRKLRPSRRLLLSRSPPPNRRLRPNRSGAQAQSCAKAQTRRVRLQAAPPKKAAKSTKPSLPEVGQTVTITAGELEGKGGNLRSIQGEGSTAFGVVQLTGTTTFEVTLLKNLVVN